MNYFPYLSQFSIQNTYQSAVLAQLAHIRDIYHSELLYRLSLNRVLLQNPSQIQNNGDLKSSSIVTKVESKSSSLQQMELDDSGNEQKISNKISHNSSLRNDTKNIPKNYGKAILTFIQKSPKTRQLIAQMGISFSDFMMQVRRAKKKVNSIESLRKMWGSQNLENKTKKCIRILSYKFMRKHCLQYIFHSKVRNYGIHIKYRQKLIEGIQNPVAFNHIKDF